MNKIIFVLLAILTVLVRPCIAVRCYVCDSNLQPGCGEPFFPDYSLLFECDSMLLVNPFRLRSTMCSKTTIRLGDATYRIQRNCGSTEYNMMEGEMCKTNPSGEFACRCFGDACNSAPSSRKVTFVSSLFLPVLILIFNHLWR